jgi:hypothetical protein
MGNGRTDQCDPRSQEESVRVRALILDFPWRLDDNFDARSKAFRVVSMFGGIVSKFQARIVPIITAADFEECRLRLYRARRVAPNNIAQWARVAAGLGSCSGDPARTACPQPEPTDLTEHWKAALRESMQDLSDWRNPQIVIAKSRSADWGTGKQIAIHCSDSEHATMRLLVRIDEYEWHPYALSDFDPWDLRHIHPIPEDGHHLHECRLPKPPQLQRHTLTGLDDALTAVRSQGWEVSGKYFFIPPKEFRPSVVEQDQWQKGRIFETRRVVVKGETRYGPIDTNGHVWLWDRSEGHWDVQLRGGGYYRISANGQKL